MNCGLPAHSPIAQTPGAVVCRRSSTFKYPLASSSTPAISSPISRVFGVRPAATSKSGAVEHPLAVGGSHPQADAVPRPPFHGVRLGTEDDLDPVLLEDRLNRLGNIGILARQQLSPPLDDRDLATEPPKRLRELDPDVAAAEHEQVGREMPELERADVGERLARGHARNVRDRRVGAEIQEDALTEDTPDASLRRNNLNGLRRHEAAFAEHEVDARSREPISMGLNQAVDHRAFSTSDALHVRRDGSRPDAVVGGFSDEVGHFRATDDVLARQASDVRTGAADERALDDDRRTTLLGQLPRDVLARLPAAEDDVLDLLDRALDDNLVMRGLLLREGFASLPLPARDSGAICRGSREGGFPHGFRLSYGLVSCWSGVRLDVVDAIRRRRPAARRGTRPTRA